MKKKFLHIFLVLITFAAAQAYSADPPPALPPDTPPGEPTDPDLPPELMRVNLNEADSKEMFDVLNKWNLVVIDRENQTKNIKTSDVMCVENIENGRHVGCSLYDDLRSRDVTKYDRFADPLFKLMVKHTTMECDDDDSDTCMSVAEKLECSLSGVIYSCRVEFYLQQPKPKNGDLK